MKINYVFFTKFQTSEGSRCYQIESVSFEHSGYDNAASCSLFLYATVFNLAHSMKV